MPARVFVGREAELDALNRLLDAAGGGECAVAVLSGEPGIGKTTLIDELLERGRELGFVTLSGRAVELERDLPFGIFADALEAELEALTPQRRGLVDDADLALLGTAFRSLRSSFPERPRQAEPDERHRLLGAIGMLPELVADSRPLVLALDDLHWADPASIDLVCRLLHRGMGIPSLLLLASRLPQCEPRLRSACEEVERYDCALRIELAPLSVVEAQMLLGTEIAPEQGEAIFRESGGNPLFLQQLAAAARRGDRLSMENGVSAELGVPAAVRATIRGELDRLSRAARVLLQGAALLEEPFEAGLAAETAGIEEDDALRALDELLEADLVRPGGVPSGFRFRHPIVRHAVYESAGAGWLLAAHGRAAVVLEARGVGASMRAVHVERSARFGEEEAVAVLVQAGQETMPRAPASAARWFDAALRLLPEREDNLELRLGLLAQRAAALGTAGQIEESREALGEFLALSPSEPSELRFQATIFAAILDELLGSHKVGRGLLLEELSKLSDQHGREAADLKRELAFTYFMDADWEAMGGWARQALGDECEGMVRVGALAALALAEFGLGELDSIRRWVSEAADIFDGLTDAEITAHHPAIATWLGWAEICTERFDDAVRHSRRSIDISRTAGQRHMTVALAVVQGQALALKGSGEELSAVADAATEAALMTSSDLFLSWAMTLRCQVSMQAGDLHAAVGFGERAVGAAATASSPQAGIARGVLAGALLEAGEPERCRELLSAANGEVELPPFPLHEALGYELLTRAEIMLGRLERAEDLAVRAEQTARRVGLQVPLAQARRARALVLLERGEPQAATVEAEASRAAAERVKATVEAARSEAIAGVAMAAAGDREAGVSALVSAHAQLVECDAQLYGDDAARRLRRLGHVVPRGAGRSLSRQGKLGLTPRESEVIELVAAGKTNRQIAELLFLSTRTVDRHVSRVFEKLGVNSRAAASSVFERARAAQLAVGKPRAGRHGRP
ncbi:MAG TPA: AAA family ATPase [Solirubrobacteraceae bacterium]|nr:AAA family ATPase [Solirubrobacteraceae bacterium]